MHDEKAFMLRALELADRPKDCILPNPRVGAVIVYNNKIVGEGYHRGPGKAHAELAAIRNAQKNGFDKFHKSSLFVTLEPCSHTNKRTPPCAPLLAEKNFSKVFVAHRDPNPSVAGNGVRLLKSKKISVRQGLLKDEAEFLNRDYIKNQKLKLPYVTAKAAMTFDGVMSSGTGLREPITGSAAQEQNHILRSRADALGVGAKTLEIDNPLLSARPNKRKLQRNVVVFGKAKRQLNWNFQKENPNREHVFLESPEALETHLSYLYEKLGFCHLFVDGGAGLLSAFFKEDQVDEFHFFYGKGLFGGSSGLRLGGAWGLKSIDKSAIVRPETAQILGSDVWISGRKHVYRTD